MSSCSAGSNGPVTIAADRWCSRSASMNDTARVTSVLRSTGVAWRYCSRNRRASEWEAFVWTNASAAMSASSGAVRARGTRTSSAVRTRMRPARTSLCTAAGSTRIRSSRPSTQRRLRPKRIARLAGSNPSTSISSRTRRPSSRADGRDAVRLMRTCISASAGFISSTCTNTRSRFRRDRAPSRLWPSTTTKKPARADGITTIGNCCPCSSMDVARARSRDRSRTRRSR